MKKIILYFCLILMSSCLKESKKKETKQSGIIGLWQTVSMTIDHSTFLNNNYSKKIHFGSEKDISDKLNINTIETLFKKDNTFTIIYKAKDISVNNSIEGKWHQTHKDSVSIEYSNGYKYECYFLIEENGEIMKLIAVLDWDKDGEKDDIYQSIEKRLY